VIDQKIVDDLAHKVADSIPPGFKTIQDDLEKNLRAAMGGLFSRLDLVSREEFEVQSAVLARTRSKLEVLEKQVAKLEAQLLK